MTSHGVRVCPPGIPAAWIATVKKREGYVNGQGGGKWKKIWKKIANEWSEKTLASKKSFYDKNCPTKNTWSAKSKESARAKRAANAGKGITKKKGAGKKKATGKKRSKLGVSQVGTYWVKNNCSAAQRTALIKAGKRGVGKAWVNANCKKSIDYYQKTIDARKARNAGGCGCAMCKTMGGCACARTRGKCQPFF